MNAARAANKYFNDEQPWKTIKSDVEYCSKTLYVCCQLVRSLAILFSPIIPYTAKKTFDLINIGNYTGENLNGQELSENLWLSASLPKLLSGTESNMPEILFKQVENEVVEFQISKLSVKNTIVPEIVEDELINIEDFQKIKLVTAKVISAEKIKKSKKLLKLQIDTGFDKRQILAGVAEFYEPEYLIGKTIVVVANLKPAKLMGQESNGMMLAASKDGKLCFVTPEIEIGEGAIVK
jgi:methionyl-tRNA synthetase